MAKKESGKKKTSQSIDEQFNSEICNLKHIAIDKEFQAVKDDASVKHAEIVELIQSLQDNIKKNVQDSHDNLKDKIILTEKIIGDKIDSLSEFDDSLKGNGTPGVWESIRALTWKFRLMIAMLSLMLILFIGGNIKGVTKEKVKAFFGWKTETKQVEDLHIYSTDGTLLKVDEKGSIVIEKKEEIPK